MLAYDGPSSLVGHKQPASTTPVVTQGNVHADHFAFTEFTEVRVSEDARISENSQISGQQERQDCFDPSVPKDAQL